MALWGWEDGYGDGRDGRMAVEMEDDRDGGMTGMGGWECPLWHI